MRFLLENEANINLKDGFINLDRCEFEISASSENRSHADRNIVEKTKTLKLSNTNNKIVELLRIM